ncbi:MAG: low temperature requirement protein A [Actinobacteria bacterium]|nr:MAG: low temperature requirement protein A [Actinomycetota bacterium]
MPRLQIRPSGADGPAADAAPQERSASSVDERVTPLELFFDLVFVFAITQVTGLLSQHPSWSGLGHGVLVLAALWWAWAAYAWLTNTVNPEEGVARLVVFAAMGAMLIASLAVPGAFRGDAEVFALAYLAMRLLQVALYLLAARDDAPLRGALRRLAPGLTLGPTILVVASVVNPSLRDALWLVALAIDWSSAFLSGTGGWRLSPGHFAERHGLIVIIALGESVVAIGVGASGLPIGARLVGEALLGLAVAGALWWVYFDVVALVAERRLRSLPFAQQVGMARDSYTYLHFPIVAGIIIAAFGIKRGLAVQSRDLGTIGAVALLGGCALNLLGLVAFRLRNLGTLNRQRLVCAVVLLAAIPALAHAPALVGIAVAAALTCGLVAYEALRFAGARQRVRGTAPAEG